MSAANISSDDELLEYLELPRAGESDEFLDKVTRRIELDRDRLAAYAESLLTKKYYLKGHGYCYLKGHGEDAASVVIFKAWRSLKKQFMGGPVAHPWLRPMPLFRWLLVVHGKPFKKKESGVITNYIRKYGKHSLVSLDELSDNGFDVEDGRLIDAETMLIRRQQLEVAFKQGRQQRESALNQLAKSEPRDVLAYRLRTGTHRFRKLDADSLAVLARDLPRAMRTTIQTIAEQIGLCSDASLDPKTIGALLGMKERRVRQIVAEVTRFIDAARSPATARPRKAPADHVGRRAARFPRGTRRAA